MTRAAGRYSKSLPGQGLSRRPWTQVTHESSGKLYGDGNLSSIHDSARRDTTAKLELFIVCRLGECCRGFKPSSLFAVISWRLCLTSAVLCVPRNAVPGRSEHSPHSKHYRETLFPRNVIRDSVPENAHPDVRLCAVLSEDTVDRGDAR